MDLPLPAFDVNAGLLPFVAVAVPMVAVTVLVLGLVRPSDARPPLVTQLLLAVAVVGGGSVLLLALLFVFLDPNGTNAWTWVLLAFNFMMMVPLGLWFIGHIVYQDRRVAEGSWLWPAGLAVAVTGSEMLMGLLFALGGASGAIGTLAALSEGLSSVWFFWSMAGVMAPLVLWAPLSSVGRAGGWALVAAAAVAAWVRPYPLEGGAAMAGLMAVAFVAFLRPLWHGTVARADGPLLLGLIGAFLGMASSGMAVALSAGSSPAVLAFGATMALVMVAEVSYLLKRTYATGLGAMSPTSVPGTTVPAEASTARPGPSAGP
jgi:hypothetical protein